MGGKNSKDMSIHELCSLEARIGMKKALNQKMTTNRIRFVHADALMDNLSLFVNSATDADMQLKGKAMRDVANTNKYGRVDEAGYSVSKAAKFERVDSQMKDAANGLMA